MRAKRKRMLYIFFLLITVLMFFRSWEAYIAPSSESADYAHKHHHGIHHKHQIKHHMNGHTVLHTV